jgi:hypothetical protein
MDLKSACIVAMRTGIVARFAKEERAPFGALFEGATKFSVLAESGYDVREHVLDLVAHRKKDHDDDD